MSRDDVTPEQWDRAIDNKATNRQVGGDHYKKLKVSPTDYIYANNLSWNLGNVVKYVTRNKDNVVNDLLKAKHYIDLELEMVHGVDGEGNNIGPYRIETKV